MALARCSTVGVTHPDVIRLDFNFHCCQVDFRRRFGGKWTSPDEEIID